MKRKIVTWVINRAKRSSQVVGLALVLFSLIFRLEMYPYKELTEYAAEESLKTVCKDHRVIPAASAPHVSSIIDYTLLRLRLVSNLQHVGETPIILIDARVPNAYALPDGRIVITLGLLERVKSFSHLAGILGHEIAHLENRNFRDQVTLDMVLLGSCLLGFSALGPIGGFTITTLSYLGSKMYQRQCEYRADETAAGLLQAAGYSKNDFASFLGAKITTEPYLPPLDDLKELNRSHPIIYKRALRLISLEN